MKKYMRYICAVLMIIGTSAHAWATHPGGNYTLVTSASDLHNGDAVILYDDVNDVGVTGTSGTSATFSSSSDDWIEYTVAKPTGSTVTLADWSLLSAPKIYADEDGNMYKFTYSTSSNTSFTINSSGHLVCSTTRLAHYGDYIRFYGSAGTPLKVYQVGSPKVYEPLCDGNLCVNPDEIYIGGEYNGVEDALLESDKFTVTTTYSGKNHYVYVEYDDDELLFDVYDYEYDEPFGSNGYYTAGTGEDISTLKIVCYASAAGTYSATLHVYAYNYDGAGNHRHVTVPIKITVLEEEQECTARTLSFANGTSDKTIYKADATTYTNAATPSTGAGYGTVTYSVTSASPSGCATVNGSGVVSFSNYGSATITASLGANGDYCAAADVSYTVSMECKSRTLTFASSTPSVSVTTDTYTQTATKSAGSGTISYAMVQSVGSGFTIDSETGEVSFNGNAGTATITASITADATGGYCTAEGSYTLTVTPVVPTVSNFSYTSGETSMTLNGSAVTDNGGTAISAYGYIYSTTASAVGTLVLGGEGVTTAQVAAANIAVGTAFAEKSITSLSEGATYYVRAYATNSAGTGYSDIQTVKTVTYSNFQFSCSELTLTKPDDGDLVFITSTAGKTVRSQERFHVTGSGLTPGATVTFSFGNSSLNALFAFKKADGTAPTVSNPGGTIDEDIYVFYTPTGTSDGLDEATNLTATVSGTKPKTATLNTKRILGRHLPADFVIAAKNTNNNKWYALPANMTGTGNPSPVEIAVDDLNNPTIAYTAASNIYNLYTNGTPYYVQLGMKNNVDGSSRSYALWANNADKSTDIGKNTGLAQSSLGSNYQWLLTQTNTSVTNAQNAKYNFSNPNNANMLKLWLAAGGTGVPYWGLYASGISELRIIPASDIIFAEAYFIEWAQHGGVIEVDAETISATKVKAILGEDESSKVTLDQTLTSGKSRASKYNYTVNFGNDIDFAAAASKGAMLTLEWYNSSDVLVAKTSMVVPKIIATSGDMKTIMSGDAQWETEVHVLPGVTLTANGGSFESSDVRINLLEIYPGAVVKVTTGTLNVASLVLRNGWTRAGAKKFDVARLHIASTANLTKANIIDGWYSDWYVDYDQYYSISVPWEVTLANVKYRYCSVSPTVGGDDGNIRLRYYDGEQRASSAQDKIGQNWKDYGKSGNKAVPSKLLPSMGYAMNAKRPTGKAFSIIRMPMDFPGNAWTAGGEKGSVTAGEPAVTTHKDQVTVTGWGYGTETPWYAMGWNFIGNPYMCEFSGNDDGITGKMELQNGGSIRYATIPDEGFKNYEQVNIASTPLRPATGFFIQANNASEQTITFSASKIVPPSAPARYMTQTETIPEQEAYIRLSYEGGKDQMGLIIGEDYTDAYEVNADLAKVLGDAGYVKTYMRYGDMDMAYVAINAMLAKEWIPVTVILPTAGEYTYSLMSSSEVEHLDGVYLIDYTTNEITNLIENDYVFTATAGTFSNRFAINAKVGERETPTDIDVVNGGGDLNSDKPFKFIYHEKVYIYHRGVIYDATGKKVR